MLKKSVVTLSPSFMTLFAPTQTQFAAWELHGKFSCYFTSVLAYHGLRHHCQGFQLDRMESGHGLRDFYIIYLKIKFSTSSCVLASTIIYI